MASTYSISPKKTGWLVTIPRHRGAGRVRKWFRDPSEASAWADANFSAIRCADLSPLTPAEVAEYRAARSLIANGESLIDAARAWATARKPSASCRVTIQKALAAYLYAKRSANLRPATLHNTVSFIGKLPQASHLSDLSAADLGLILSPMPPISRNSYIAAWRAFWRWCIRSGLCTVNPAEDLAVARIDFAAPCIYTPAQAEAVLRAAEKTDPKMVAYIAVAAFAGVRSAGLRMLTAGDVDASKGVVFVPGHADKMRRSYSVAMVPNLLEWLKSYQFARLSICREAVNARLRKIHAAAGVPQVRNGWRHSFGSYYCALHSGIEASNALGHFGSDLSILLSNYRRLVTEEQASEYFAILPNLETIRRRQPQPSAQSVAS